MKKFTLSLLIILSGIVAVVIFNTVLHQPDESFNVPKVEIELDSNLLAQHLSEAIQFQTISYQDKAKKQQKEFDGFINWIATTYPELHQNLSLQRLNDTLLYKWQGSDKSKKPVLITGHYDVVPVIPGTEKLWKQSPFAGVISDEIIWGRGALDDKSAVIALLEATNYLVKKGHQPNRSIYLSFGHDEEIGGFNGAALVTKTLKQEGVQLEWSLDEGSFIFDKMIPGVNQLMATINVAEKGNLTLSIVAKSAGGHSSMPPQQTAVGILANAIIKLESNPVAGGLEGLSLQMFDTMSQYMPFGKRMLFANQWLFGSLLDDKLSSNPMTNAMLRTTTAPTMLSASVKTNILPIEAKAIVNFRVHPRDTVEDIIAHVKRIVENDNVSVFPAEGNKEASEVSDWNSSGFNLIETSVKEIYGDVIITPGLMVAASDSTHYAKIADNSFRFNPIIMSSEDLTGFHGTNEKISIARLEKGTKTYIQILKHASK